MALQITNILRDIVEDRDHMGRVYLPAEDLERFGVAPDLRGPVDGVMALISFEAARAEEWYDRGLELLPMLDWRSRACTAAMAGIYRRLLVRIQRDPAGVLRGRMSLPGWEKAAVAVAGPGERVGVSRHAQTGAGRHVVVIGGGLAGLAAALECADRGAHVTLLERRNRLGGLTWSFRHSGHWVDNGQHVFLRCCLEYLSFLDRIGAGSEVELPDRLDIPVVAPALRPGGVPRLGRLRRSDLPAPLHLLGSLLRFPHLSVGDRLGLGRAVLALRRLDLRDPALDNETFGSWLARHGQSPAAVASPVGPDHGPDRQPASRGGVTGHGGQGLQDRAAHRHAGRGHRLEPGAVGPAARRAGRGRPDPGRRRRAAGGAGAGGATRGPGAAGRPSGPVRGDDPGGAHCG